MVERRLAPARTVADVSRLAELVRAAYVHCVERIGGPPRPMTDDYAEVVRTHRVIVAEPGGEILGLVVLGVGDEGFLRRQRCRRPFAPGGWRGQGPSRAR